MDKIKIEIEFYCNGKIHNQILDIDKIYKFDGTNSIFNIYAYANSYNHMNELKSKLNNSFLNNIIQFISYNKNYSYNNDGYAGFDSICFIIHKINFYIEDNKYYLNCNFIEDNEDLILNRNLNHFILLSSVNYNFENNNKLYNGNINNIVINRRIMLSNNNDPNSYYYSDNLRFSYIISIILQHIFYQEYLKENNQELITFKQLTDYIKDFQPQINNLQKDIKFTQDEINKEFKKIEENISEEIFKNYQENIQINKELQKEINILKEEIKQLKQTDNDNDIKIIQEEVINELNRSSKETYYSLYTLKRDLIRNMFYSNNKTNKKIQSNEQNYNNYNIIINLLILIMFVCYIYFYHF